MLVFPNAKINLGLKVLNRRADGYHNIESLMIPIGLKDILEVVVSDKDTDSLHLLGEQVEGHPSDNLCLKAVSLLRRDFIIPPLHIYLHKIIPTGAGLGGGSANAAFMLKLLNDMFELNISAQMLVEYAAVLGSDCPFFIENTPMIASGRGEVLTPFSLDLKGIYIALVKAPVSVSTAMAYSNIEKGQSFTDSFSFPTDRSRWREEVTNSFEPWVFKQYPEVGEIKDSLYSAGAFFALMSGSGSAVYAFFNESLDIKPLFPEYFVWQNKF